MSRPELRALEWSPGDEPRWELRRVEPSPREEEGPIAVHRLADALRRVRAADAVLGALEGAWGPGLVSLRGHYLDELRAAVGDVARCNDAVAMAGARAVLARWGG